MTSHRLARVTTTILALVAATLLAPAPAQADALDVTCTPPSSTTATYTPPLTATPHNVTITRTSLYGPCTSATVPGLSSGVIAQTIQVNRSCADLLAPSVNVATISWNTGQTSVLTTNTIVAIAGALYVVTQTGTVTSGLFQGDSVVRSAQAPATDLLLCLAGLGSVSALYFIDELLITSLN